MPDTKGKKLIIIIIAAVVLSAGAFFLLRSGKETPKVQPTPSPTGIQAQCADLVEQGNALMKERKPFEALKFFNEALKLDENFSPALSGRTNAYIDLGRFDEAMSDAQKAIKLSPEVPLNYVNRGNAWYYTGNPEKALEDYRKTISMKPEYPPDESKAHYGIGRIAEERGDMETAFKEYDQAVHFHNVARNYMSRGQAHRKLGRNEEGRSDYMEALKQKPDKASLLTAIGETWYSDDQPDKAIEFYNKAIESDPDFTRDPEFRDACGNPPSGFTFPYTRRAVIYIEKGRYKEAVEDISKSIELKNDHPDDYYYRARAYWYLGESDKAAKDAKKYLELEKNHAGQEKQSEKIEKQGAALMILGREKQALEDFDKAQKMNPFEFTSYNMRGIILHKQGRDDLARKDFEKAANSGIISEQEKAREYLNKIVNKTK
ncbi:MAG: tetratricopeptide repeat protein [Firmicutes bacterium]|nr:tetratricopeptide repeat protein [Bacillota bacterium]